MSKITPSLWFNDDLEEAIEYYRTVFPNVAVHSMQRYGEAGPGTPGTVVSAEFEIEGQRFVGINGGADFPFTEAVSFVVDCADQAEVDHYWDRLSGDGGKQSQCGWLKDKFGLSWQIVPRALHATVNGPDREGARRATEAMLKMRKLIVADLERAYKG